MSKPIILVTNDDSIDSLLLLHLVQALQEAFTIFVAAPKYQQSWISKAVSRRQNVRVQPLLDWECEGWIIDGTPTDCVNIALGHLMPTRPAAVVSGINIGANTMLPLVFSSGTVAGALEGALWDLPAIAFSQYLTPQQFRWAHQSKRTEPEPEWEATFQISARKACAMTQELIHVPRKGIVVNNINFPSNITADSKVVEVPPENAKSQALFQKSSDDEYTFSFPDWENGPQAGCDRDRLLKGDITLSVLNYSQLSQS